MSKISILHTETFLKKYKSGTSGQLYTIKNVPEDYDVIKLDKLFEKMNKGTLPTKVDYEITN